MPHCFADIAVLKLKKPVTSIQPVKLVGSVRKCPLAPARGQLNQRCRASLAGCSAAPCTHAPTLSASHAALPRLPAKPDWNNPAPDWTPVTVVGLGRTSYQGDTFPTVLQEARTAGSRRRHDEPVPLLQAAQRQPCTTGLCFRSPMQIGLTLLPARQCQVQLSAAAKEAGEVLRTRFQTNAMICSLSECVLLGCRCGAAGSMWLVQRGSARRIVLSFLAHPAVPPSANLLLSALFPPQSWTALAPSATATLVAPCWSPAPLQLRMCRCILGAAKCSAVRCGAVHATHCVRRAAMAARRHCACALLPASFPSDGWSQIGVVSWSYKNPEKKACLTIPGVFSDVGALFPWVDAQVLSMTGARLTPGRLPIQPFAPVYSRGGCCLGGVGGQGHCRHLRCIHSKGCTRPAATACAMMSSA